MGVRDLFFGAVVVGGVALLGAGVARTPGRAADPGKPRAVAKEARDPSFRGAVASIDQAFRRRWDGQGLAPAPEASDLAIARRLSLALTGTVPSLEEIRRFEARRGADRLERWLDELLTDRRTADYLAERFARSLVGTEDGPFLLFRRRRFTTWLSDSFLADRPYDALVRDMIADHGIWTDHPATNFLTVTFNQESSRPDPERLGARVARAFLGVRLDCAQCHDHPFQPWKQDDFRGLAAFFGGLHANLRGLRDEESDYKPPARKSREPTKVEPHVPFRPDLLPAAGSPRERLAAWVVAPENPNLARATANRVWALLLGRPLVEPIDDLGSTSDQHPALDILARDFAAHGYDLHRLIRLIAASRPFRLDSAGVDDEQTAEAEWAVFPLTRLRPEQVAGAVLQSASLAAIGEESNWLVRLAAYNGRNEFVRRYGDTGEDEFDARGGTIPQRLLLLNGDLVRDKTNAGLFNASAALAALAPSDRKAVEAAYLAVLTRRPTEEESAFFAARLAETKGDPRKERLADLFWTLINTTEFSWYH